MWRCWERHTERKRARLALARELCGVAQIANATLRERASSRRVPALALPRGETREPTELRSVRGGYERKRERDQERERVRERERARAQAAGSRGERGGDLATGICNELDTQGSRRGDGRDDCRG